MALDPALVDYVCAALKLDGGGESLADALTHLDDPLRGMSKSRLTSLLSTAIGAPDPEAQRILEEHVRRMGAGPKRTISIPKTYLPPEVSWRRDMWIDEYEAIPKTALDSLLPPPKSSPPTIWWGPANGSDFTFEPAKSWFAPKPPEQPKPVPTDRPELAGEDVGSW